jgi:predicted transcriptional regulator
VRVTAVADADVGISGQLGVVREVPADHVPDVVAAGRAGVTDLVAVPLASQAVLS